MKRGISFLLPNLYGAPLADLLSPVDLTAYNWLVDGVESYIIEEDTLGGPLFPNSIETIDGGRFKERIGTGRHYLIFVDIKAFPAGSKVHEVEDYGQFTSSGCELALIIVDSVYAALYCKDQELLARLKENAVRQGYEDVAYITDDNDFRTRLAAF
ncbi:DUF2691 family protein [Paenibacillus sp. UNC499MF]|uniref:DUF2691 family protein n=1 Tax=Paenibacillus sp. UNC499MF TaxID=1502751 RepID=UPI0008A08F94|nr:DUF2691 family protein [Paenibacillus sp. UNC499MF]SEG55720.1 Protein of unknown function [Paenibacillus sp. UNC499MF]